MNVQVFAQTYLENYIKNGGNVYSHLISIGNPKSSIRRQEDCYLPAVFRKTFKSILRFSFYDVLEKHHLGPHQKIKRIPRKADVKRMIRYYNKTKNTATGYTFHCWAGVSRSGAMALGVLYLIYKDEKKAAEELIKIRSIVRPHQ